MTRILPILFLAACGVPVEEEGLTMLAGDIVAPPGVPLDMDITALAAGASATFTVNDADPGEQVWILRTTNGMGVGPCPGFMGGECVDLQTPISPMGPFTASGAGVASVTATVPASVPYGTEACFQAIALRGPGGVDTVKSDVVCRVTNNGPVSLEQGNNTDEVSISAYTGGPNLQFAMKHVSTTQSVIGYIEVFSGLVSGANTVEIWTHDTSLDQPGAPVASAAWTSTENLEWQGGNLGIRHIMPQGSTWWIVWSMQSGQRSTLSSGPGTMGQYRGSFDGGTTWNGPYTNRTKYKLCGGGGCP